MTEKKNSETEINKTLKNYLEIALRLSELCDRKSGKDFILRY